MAKKTSKSKTAPEKSTMIKIAEKVGELAGKIVNQKDHMVEMAGDAIGAVKENVQDITAKKPVVKKAAKKAVKKVIKKTETKVIKPAAKKITRSVPVKKVAVAKKTAESVVKKAIKKVSKKAAPKKK